MIIRKVIIIIIVVVYEHEIERWQYSKEERQNKFHKNAKLMNYHCGKAMTQSQFKHDVVQHLMHESITFLAYKMKHLPPSLYLSYFICRIFRVIWSEIIFFFVRILQKIGKKTKNEKMKRARIWVEMCA